MNTHDALVAAARDSKGDLTPLSALADWLEENRQPGAAMLREAVDFHQKFGGVNFIHDFYVGRDIPSHLGGNRAVSLPGPVEYRPRHHIFLFAAKPNPFGAKALLVVHHRYDNAPHHYPASYIVPVYSKHHLDYLTSDWPDSLAVEKQDLQARLKPYLPDTHEPQQMKRMAKRPLRYAAVSLTPGVPGKHLSGETMFTHRYTSPLGSGVVKTIPRNEGKTLHIEYVGPENVSPGEVGNTEGPGNIREIMRQLAPHYPNAETVTGRHFGGAKPGGRIVRPIPGRGGKAGRLQRSPIRMAAEPGRIIRRDNDLADLKIHPIYYRDNGRLGTVGVNLRRSLDFTSPQDEIHQIARTALETGDMTPALVFSDALRESGWGSDQKNEPAFDTHAILARLMSMGHSAEQSGRLFDNIRDEQGRRYDHPDVAIGAFDPIWRRFASHPYGFRVGRGRQLVLNPEPATFRQPRPRKPKDELPPLPSRRPLTSQRRGRPLLKAKVDGHVQAHPLVEGFPIEHALRHLANDPNNTMAVRDIAKVALTGGEKGDATPTALWMLHDALQESGHPAKDWYNWMSAADKVGLDQHTHRALTEAAEDTRRRQVASGLVYTPWEQTPEAHATDAMLALDPKRGGNPNYPPRLRRDALLHRVRERVKSLQPGTPDKLIEESIRRHAWRAHRTWRRMNGLDEADPKDLGPYVTRKLPQGIKRPHLELNEQATRYTRRPLRFSGHESSDFHGPMHENAEEQTNPLAYADWLEENGDPEIATIIRQHLRSQNYGSESVGGLGETPLNKFGLSYASYGPGRPGFIMAHQNVAHNPSQSFFWHSDQMQPHEAASLLAGAKARGHVLDKNAEALVQAHGPRQLRRRYALNARGDFIESLRRIRSANQVNFRKAAQQIAARLGLRPVSTLDALHDTPSGSTPGIAQAIYGMHRPEAIHEAAAWYGLTNNAPGVAVFHPRPGGRDMLYRFRQAGSGLDLRAKLDRFGLTNRILIPHRTGFDVLIPDQGGRQGRAVQQFAQNQGVQLQVSPGHFKVIGSTDQAAARDKFRNTVVRSEKMQRGPRRYSSGLTHADFVESIASDPKNATKSLAYADWLEENGMPTFASVIRRHVDREKGTKGPHVMLGKPPPGGAEYITPYTPIAKAEKIGSISPHHNLIYVKQLIPNRNYGHYYSLIANEDEVNDILDNLEKEGIRYVPGSHFTFPRRRKLHRRYALAIPESTMKSNANTLADKRRRIVATAQRRLVEKTNSMPVEEAASRLVDAIKVHGPLHKRAIYRHTRLIGPPLDAAAKHAGLKVEQRPAHANGGGPLTTWYSLGGK